MPEVTFLPVSSALTGCPLLRCIWYERGQPTSTTRTGFWNQRTQRYILTDHGSQNSAQGPSGDVTRGGGSNIVVFSARCTPLSLQATAGVRQRQNYLRVVMRKVKVDRSDEYLKNKCKMHLVHLYLKRQLFLRRAVAVTGAATKHRR